VDAPILATLVVLSAGALALWVVSRFPSLAPQNMRAAMMHVFVSLVLGTLAVPLLKPFTEALQHPLDVHALIFLLVLPTATYRFVSTIWFIAAAQGALRGRLP
jgi:hypothetical protein